jgi:hypothetical protein
LRHTGLRTGGGLLLRLSQQEEAATRQSDGFLVIIYVAIHNLV